MERHDPIKPAQSRKPKQQRNSSTSRQHSSPKDSSNDKLVEDTSANGMIEFAASINPTAKAFDQHLDELRVLPPHLLSLSDNGQEPDWLEYAHEHYYNNLLLYVKEIYPWGKVGTPLEFYDGPDTWQMEYLENIRTGYCESESSLWYAIASGRGVGKTTALVWTIQWFIATRKHPLILVTASNANQLSVVTWRELALWHYMSPLTKDFELLRTLYRHRKHPDTWFAKAQPWSTTHPEAFQGAHDKEMLIIMDEASGIDDIIWDTIQGNFSRGHGLWLAFGNPLWNTGRFRQCFPGGRFSHRWHYRRVDSRQAKMADKEEITKWIEDYGENSDHVKKYVKGEFPEVEEGQFIPKSIIDAAIKRESIFDHRARCIIGIDVARSLTGDASAICVREGDRILYLKSFREQNGNLIRDRFCEVIDMFKEKNPNIFVDSSAGWGLMADMLKDKGVKNIDEAKGGGTPDDSYHYGNQRAEMWSRMKRWIETKGCLDAKYENLISELTQVHYRFENDSLYMERKEDMKARGLTSGDEADALAFTFTKELGPISPYNGHGQVAHGTYFDPLTLTAKGDWKTYWPG